MMLHKNATDLKGRRFGSLVAVHPTRSNRLRRGKPKLAWLCRCDCGKETIVDPSDLVMDHTTSCGCLCKERPWMRKSRHDNVSEYTIWVTMRRRCSARTGRSWRFYGARGITVCDDWNQPGEVGFSAFLRDVGKRPSQRHTLERIDTFKGYQPGNVKWATMKEQANNTRRNICIEINGEKLTATQIASRFNLSKATVAWRIKRGWLANDVIRPPRKQKNNYDPEQIMNEHARAA